MATANPISSSCQSIATASLGNVAVATSAAGGSLRTGNGNGNTTHYVMGTGSLGRLKYHNKHKSLDASDEELEYSQLSQSTHILGRVKSERFLASKVDEDRRRRTIIVEKKNDSFGFTLQSYGIHYKKDQEVEMITYVDYVEYDGAAYRAGMREGDVILSINGRDMEKADHKTLVDYIKSCDTRMRMVVLFEDCVRKVELHMRYIQLQNMLQNKMNELEKICIRERELLEGKWKTHSLPARKKATTSPTDVTDTGSSPTDAELNLPYYRSTLSTEDVTNIARQTQQTIIPPPAQFMLSYHYFDPHYRYVMKPSTSTNSSGECFVTIGEPLTRAESGDTTTAPATSTHFTSQRRASNSQPPAPPPRTCEKHKPPNKPQQQYQNQQQAQQHQPQKQDLNSAHKSSKAGKHCHGHSCNPCIDFRWKSAEKSAAAAAVAGNGDNVSLDAYDLASPCCDTHCVPSRRRTRHHHKEHTHKHKHRDRDRERDHETKERPPRPKSQSHVTSGITRHHHHHHVTADTGQHQHHYYEHQQPQQQQHQQSQHHHHQKSHGCDSHTGSIRSRYFDIASGLASRCSLHSCTSSEFAPADSASYTTSISTDTLFYDPNSENPATSRQHSTKSRQSCQQQQPQQQQQTQQQPQSYHHSHHQHQHHQQQQQQPSQQQQQQQQQQQYMQHAMYQQRYHITATQVQPAQIYPNSAYVHKPKSWDNLTAANIGAYGYGYGYLDTVAIKPVVNLQIAQQRHSIPRKNPYGRYSTYTDVENYAPPPTEFVEQVTTTTTTITAKSTEELIATSQSGCDCMTPKQHQQAIKLAKLQLNQNQQVSQHNNCQMGYYSHLAQPKIDATTSTTAQNAPSCNASTAVNAATNANATVGTSTTANVSGSNVATVTEVTRL